MGRVRDATAVSYVSISVVHGCGRNGCLERSQSSSRRQQVMETDGLEISPKTPSGRIMGAKEKAAPKTGLAEARTRPLSHSSLCRQKISGDALKYSNLPYLSPLVATEVCCTALITGSAWETPQQLCLRSSTSSPHERARRRGAKMSMSQKCRKA